MDKVSLEKMNLRDIIKDNLSFRFRLLNLNDCKGHPKGHFVL